LGSGISLFIEAPTTINSERGAEFEGAVIALFPSVLHFEHAHHSALCTDYQPVFHFPGIGFNKMADPYFCSLWTVSNCNLQ
jgi:hypothetical protein